MHMSTLPDAVPGIPKGGSLPPRPHPPERHRRSSGRGATATQPPTCGTAGVHMEAAFSCTCTPMSMCTRGTPPTPGDRRSKSTSRKLARTPSRYSHRSSFRGADRGTYKTCRGRLCAGAVRFARVGQIGQDLSCHQPEGSHADAEREGREVRLRPTHRPRPPRRPSRWPSMGARLSWCSR